MANFRLALLILAATAAELTGCGTTATEFGSGGSLDGLENVEDSNQRADQNGVNTNPPAEEQSEASNPPPVETSQQVLALCSDPGVQHLNLVRQLNFPARSGCQYNQNGNGPATNGVIMARAVQEQIIDLPSSSVICGVTQFSSGQTSSLRYDDLMFVTLDDYVLLGSSTLLMNSLESENGLRTWDWSRIYGEPFSQVVPYCLGASCVFPGHDQQGPIELSFQSSEMAELSAKLAQKEQASLKVITTGDNDTDCMHTGFDIRLELDYIVR